MANKWAKIMASLWLIWILASVIWTGILYFVESNRAKEEQQRIIENMTKSWTTVEVSTWTTSNSGNSLSGSLVK